MCRMVAYFGGPEATLSSVILEPEHSLLVQSYAPQEMLSGTVNADGFGAGWYVPWAGEEPAVYRSGRPVWADGSFASLAPRTRARCFFAAVRSATPPLPPQESGTPPFSCGRYLFMHNGAIEGFQRSVMRPLRNALSDESYAALSGSTDSETVFAVLLDALRDGEDLGNALRSTVRRIAGVCEETGTMARLNLAVTDGQEMVFARYSTRGPGNSLYLLENGASFPGAVVVASERLDEDPGWWKVPDRHLLVAGRSGVSLRPM
jgi:glutamine amidotransferase